MSTTTLATRLATLFTAFYLAKRLLTISKWTWKTFYVSRWRWDLVGRYGLRGEGTTTTTTTTWAVVTGASSGVGESYSRELARRGFNVILIARREDNLRELRSKISAESSRVKVEILPWDVETGLNDELIEKIKAIGASLTKSSFVDVGVFVHMAGNSDLARHFTDKSFARNWSVHELNCKSTLYLMQRLVPIFLRRPEGTRSAFITSGAMSAELPLPCFAASSANKHFNRGLTLAANAEFEGAIDFMIAHPIAVYSEIVKNPTPVAISAEVFARNSLNDLGYRVETNGSWKHDLFMGFFRDVMSSSRRDAMWVGRASHFSTILGRPVDLRPIREKVAKPLDSSLYA